MALPAPTALAATTRYIPAGTRRYTIVTTIASKAAPTSAELAAGTDITGEIPPDGVSGFTKSTEDVKTGDFANLFQGSIPGYQSADNSTIKTYLSTNATDARSLLTEGLNAFVVIYNEGIVASGKCSVFPIRIGSSNPDQVAANAPATMTTMFYITSAPVMNIAIPTA